jgi:hypothetical protein
MDWELTEQALTSNYWNRWGKSSDDSSGGAGETLDPITVESI